MTVLLFLLGFLLPSQTAIHFWPDFSFVGSIRIDYLSPTLYLTDILIIFITIFNLHALKKITKIGVLPLLLLFFLLNFIFSYSPWVTLIAELRLLVYACFLIVLINFPAKTLHSLFWGLLGSLFWVSVLSLLQFVHQGSLGGIWVLLGERPLNIFSSAVSTVSLGSLGQFIRAYATLPHPNSLAGYLVISWLLIQFSKNQFTSGFTKVFKVTTFLVVMSLILTFSRTALLTAFILAGLSYFFRSSLPRVFKVLFPLALFLLVLQIIPGNPDSLYLRFQQIKLSSPFLISPSLFGTGMNAFIPSAGGITLQPLHNVYLLILAEIGYVGVTILGVLIYLYFKNIPEVSREIKIAWIFIFITALFDHYWITLHQNQLLVIILSYSTIRNTCFRQN